MTTMKFDESFPKILYDTVPYVSQRRARFNLSTIKFDVLRCSNNSQMPLKERSFLRRTFWTFSKNATCFPWPSELLIKRRGFKACESVDSTPARYASRFGWRRWRRSRCKIRTRTHVPYTRPASGRACCRPPAIQPISSSRSGCRRHIRRSTGSCVAPLCCANCQNNMGLISC